MAKSSALSNSVLYGLGSLAKACASFFLLPLYTSILGAEQYGQLSVLQTISVIISTIITLALERSIYRLYHDYKSDEDKIRFLSTVFLAINGIGLVVVVLFILFGHYLTPYLGGVDFMTGLLPVVLYSYVNANINYCQIILQTKQEGRNYVFISLLFLGLYNMLSIALLFLYSPTYYSMVIATLITTIIILPISFSLVRKQIRCFFDWNIMKSVLTFSMPILAMVLFSWLMNFSDRLFLANLTKMEDVGLYSFAAKIVTVIPLFGGAVYQSYVPYFFDITNKLSYQDAKKKLKPINDALVFIVCILCLGLTLIYKLLLHSIFSSDYYDSLDFFYLLIMGAMVGQQTGLLNNMLLQNKKSGKMSLVSIVAGFMSVLLNVLLINTVGRIGAAISNFVVSCILVGGTLILARREYYIPFNYKILLGSLTCVVLMYLVDSLLVDMIVQMGIKLAFVLGFIWIIFKFNVFDAVVLRKIILSAVNKFKSYHK